MPAQALEPHNSRLSQLVRRKPNLFLPSRILIGTENRFIIQGQAGSHVALYVSPDDQGFDSPGGQPLRVGKEHQEFTGLIPENGVLEMTVPMPNEAVLVGKQVYIEGVIWRVDDFSDMTVMDITDATGRRTAENGLEISKAANGKGAFIVPSMPGMPSGLMQQLSTLSEVQNGDKRKLELIDSDGVMNKQLMMDKNVFINRSGYTQQNR